MTCIEFSGPSKPGKLHDQFVALLDNEVSPETTREALRSLSLNFAHGPEASGSAMAGRAELGVGDPQEVALSTAFLASDVLRALGSA